MRAAAAQTLAARRTREEVDADRCAAPGTERPHLAHFGDDAQQLFGRRDSALHLREPVFAEADHAAAERRFPDLVLGRPRRDQPAHLVGDTHHFVDADAAAIPGVIALVAPDRLVERDRRGVGIVDVQRSQRIARRRVLAPAVHAEPPYEALRDDPDER